MLGCIQLIGIEISHTIRLRIDNCIESRIRQFGETNHVAEDLLLVAATTFVLFDFTKVAVFPHQRSRIDPTKRTDIRFHVQLLDPVTLALRTVGNPFADSRYHPWLLSWSVFRRKKGIKPIHAPTVVTFHLTLGSSTFRPLGITFHLLLRPAIGFPVVGMQLPVDDRLLGREFFQNGTVVQEPLAFAFGFGQIAFKTGNITEIAKKIGAIDNRTQIMAVALHILLLPASKTLACQHQPFESERIPRSTQHRPQIHSPALIQQRARHRNGKFQIDLPVAFGHITKIAHRDRHLLDLQIHHRLFELFVVRCRHEQEFFSIRRRIGDLLSRLFGNAVPWFGKRDGLARQSDCDTGIARLTQLRELSRTAPHKERED